MTDFPGSLLEFQERFPDQEACAAYLSRLRWPAGFVCPACGSSRGWALATKAHTHECADCRKQTSVTAGTVMHCEPAWNIGSDSNSVQSRLLLFTPRIAVVLPRDQCLHDHTSVV